MKCLEKEGCGKEMEGSEGLSGHLIFVGYLIFALKFQNQKEQILQRHS